VHKRLPAVDEIMETAFNTGSKSDCMFLPATSTMTPRHFLCPVQTHRYPALKNNSVVFDFMQLFCSHKLEAVHAGTVHVDMGIGFADDLAFERIGKCDGDIDVRNFDFDVARFQRRFR
jgi:hypothetical protein